MKKLFAVMSLAGALLMVPDVARAELTLDIEEPRVFSIQERPYRLGHEFTLGVGLLPMDSFYIGSVASGSYTYHFSDFWAWEMIHGNFSLSSCRSLGSSRCEVVGIESPSSRPAHSW